MEYSYTFLTVFNRKKQDLIELFVETYRDQLR